jgi:hypothetical protein
MSEKSESRKPLYIPILIAGAINTAAGIALDFHRYGFALYLSLSAMQFVIWNRGSNMTSEHEVKQAKQAKQAESFGSEIDPEDVLPREY